MKLRRYGVLLAFACSLTSLSMAQSFSGSSEQYVPRLADIMNSLQSRHIKLWFAGKARNWDLAAHELKQMRGSLEEAATLYVGIPVTNVTKMSDPLVSVADAIAAKDSTRFAKSYGELTAGCNGCHQSMGRGFITMQVPAGQPFSDQLFAPHNNP